jgi:hypothetical protein
MDKDILKAWDDNQKLVREWISTIDIEDISYKGLLENTLRILYKDHSSDFPDYNRITEVDNGDYQGTLVFVIGGQEYQPSIEDHWYTSVSYGSCSGCDTLEAIRVCGDGHPQPEQVEDYWTLCLHMMQKMKRMRG